MVCAHEELARAPLTSPRVRYTQANLGGDRVSFWAFTRSQKEETAFFKFLGVPRFLLLELAELALPYLPEKYDKRSVHRGAPAV